MSVGKLTMTFSVTEMPEVIWALRHEMAELLREGAASEADTRVAQRLRDYAVAFEMGRRDV